MLLFFVFLFKNIERKFNNLKLLVLQRNHVDSFEPRGRGPDQVPGGGGQLLGLHPARASAMEMLPDCSQVINFH
jgi:hypothetical protein